MKYGFNMFSKEEIDQEQLLKQLNLNKQETLFINRNDDWSKFNDNINTIIEYNGRLGTEDDDKYVGYIYYDVSTDIEEIRDLFMNINNSNIVIDTE
ncbi:hypothetical protein [uncultured Clostridium sp.]|uniref:hypothetical protein n=1 Tax=uncultured Clostridium sp. TaxID=59620 RepID=UPI0025F9ADC9|nr:hypothetical protein [uncultured Clostridium sp.]